MEPNEIGPTFPSLFHLGRPLLLLANWFPRGEAALFAFRQRTIRLSETNFGDQARGLGRIDRSLCFGE